MSDDAPESPPSGSPSKPALLGPERDLAIRDTVRAVGVSGLVMALGGLLAVDLRTGIGVFVGGALATANLMLFARLGAAFLSQKGSSAPWAVIGLVKLLGLFACVYILIQRGDVSALALACGYGAMPIGITLASLFRRPDPSDEPQT